MKFSWIISSIVAYLIGVLLYIFIDSQAPLCGHAFWIGNGVMTILGWMFNFIDKKTVYEKAFILYFSSWRLLQIVYYIIGLKLGKLEWMSTHVYFWGVMVISSGIGMIFWRYKENKRWKRLKR